eukprot:1726594-Rhodomonas_salina.1
MRRHGIMKTTVGRQFGAESEINQLSFIQVIQLFQASAAHAHHRRRGRSHPAFLAPVIRQLDVKAGLAPLGLRQVEADLS